MAWCSGRCLASLQDLYEKLIIATEVPSSQLPVAALQLFLFKVFEFGHGWYGSAPVSSLTTQRMCMMKVDYFLRRWGFFFFSHSVDFLTKQQNHSLVV